MSSFILKLIAAASMLCDHAEMILFPRADVLRIIGRLAFPLYAFCIAEGFRYTRSRMKYFLRVFVLGVLCQIVFYIAEHDLYLGILITFSFSIVLMALIDGVKVSLRGEQSAVSSLWERMTGNPLSPAADRAVSVSLAALFTLFLWFFTSWAEVDYGFFGILAPAAAGLFEEKRPRAVSFSLCVLAVALACRTSFPIQFWSLCALPLVFLYNGKPGKVRMKYFFYVFYPAHFVLLYGISMLLKR